MNKTKTLLMNATLAILVVTAIVGAVYAQNVSEQDMVSAQNSLSQVPQTPSLAGTYNGYGLGNNTCPRVSGSKTWWFPTTGYSCGMGIHGE